MSINFFKERHFVAFWYAYEAEPERWEELGNVNLMGALYHDGDDTLTFVYRFAYSGLNDEPISKSWYEFHWKYTPESKRVAIAGGHMIAQGAANMSQSKYDFVELEMDGESAMEKLLAYPWMHVVAEGVATPEALDAFKQQTYRK